MVFLGFLLEFLNIFMLFMQRFVT